MEARTQPSLTRRLEAFSNYLSSHTGATGEWRLSSTRVTHTSRHLAGWEGANTHSHRRTHTRTHSAAQSVSPFSLDQTRSLTIARIVLRQLARRHSQGRSEGLAQHSGRHAPYSSAASPPLTSGDPIPHQPAERPPVPSGHSCQHGTLVATQASTHAPAPHSVMQECPPPHCTTIQTREHITGPAGSPFTAAPTPAHPHPAHGAAELPSAATIRLHRRCRSSVTPSRGERLAPRSGRSEPTPSQPATPTGLAGAALAPP